MPLVRFTENIQRHVACPDRQVAGTTLLQALEAYFRGDQAAARSYVLDDTGALRKHMAIFINSEPLYDRISLSDKVDDESIIDVMQALSGG
jgi:molybdopterin synthase sulfur carrier subunit